MNLRDALVGREALADALAGLGVEPAQLEASVRSDAQTLRSDRMMIERAPDGVLEVLLDAFAVPRSAALEELEQLASELAVPRILGWDATRGCVKLYVNGSDASEATRARLGAHVLGINAFADGSSERKHYLQHPDATGLGPVAAGLVAQAGDLAAGMVESREDGGASRAFFVALRPATPEALDAAFRHLPGFSWSALVERAPFPPASPRSIGIAAARPREWTAYLKPRAAAEPEVWSLEPVGVYELGPAEVALHVAPSHVVLRAYAQVGALALSYRVLRGEPGRAHVEAIMTWLARHAEGAETPTEVEVRLRITDPPGSWRRR